MTATDADRLYVLAFDHRGSFKKRMFGIADRDPTPEEWTALRDAKRLVWEGVQTAIRDGAPRERVGVLVDEEMGAGIAREASRVGVRLAMPVEASGRSVFDFEYGEEFGSHIRDFDPDFAKVLVRWNPADDDADKSDQADRLLRLSRWLRDDDRRFLFELLVPATDRQLELAGGDAAAYDAEIRPALTLEAIAEIQDAGIEPDIWKIEGLDRRTQCELLSGVIRRGGRTGVTAVVLGRGADDAKVEHWLSEAAGVPGYRGFAIGRTIWWSAVEAFRDGSMGRETAAADVAARYRRFVDLYESRAG